nr:MAG TPA: hypothetical protein [Caudoviricetes sp.]
MFHITNPFILLFEGRCLYQKYLPYAEEKSYPITKRGHRMTAVISNAQHDKLLIIKKASDL